MTKREFLDALKEKLSFLSGKELSDRLDFFGEMIDDLTEEGLSEEEAVSRIGSVDKVAWQIIADMHSSGSDTESKGKEKDEYKYEDKDKYKYKDKEKDKEKNKRSSTERRKEGRRLGIWEILLIVLASPIWLPLALSVISIVLSVFVSVGSVVISVWVTFAALAVSGAASLLFGAAMTVLGRPAVGLVLIGSGLAVSGIAIFCFFACRIVTRLSCLICVRSFLLVKDKIKKGGERK